MPEHLNEIISFSVKEFESGYVCKKYENLIVKGVSYKSNSVGYKVVLGSGLNKSNELYYDTVRYGRVIVNVASVKNLTDFLKDLRTRNVKAYIVSSDLMYSFEESRDTFNWVFLAISGVLSLLLLLFVINLISASIKNQRKEIGILRALGARSKDIFKIFIYESLLIAAISCIVCIGGVFLAAWLFNIGFTAGYFVYVNLLFVTWSTALITLAASFILIGLATVIPLIKIIKMRPIDAIKNL